MLAQIPRIERVILRERPAGSLVGVGNAEFYFVTQNSNCFRAREPDDLLARDLRSETRRTGSPASRGAHPSSPSLPLASDQRITTSQRSRGVFQRYRYNRDLPPSSHEVHFQAMPKPASITDLGTKPNERSWPRAE